jgi:NAD(P)-dependent dehydrogenase (short-subunit alcohol dehydrogenase family)
MSPSDKTVYLGLFVHSSCCCTASDCSTFLLVSGANRGIGYGLVATIAARPNTIIFAGARDPAAQSLKELAAKHSNVHPVKLTSGDKADNEAAIAEIQKTAGRLDVIIANAGTLIVLLLLFSLMLTVV